MGPAGLYLFELVNYVVKMERMGQNSMFTPLVKEANSGEFDPHPSSPKIQKMDFRGGVFMWNLASRSGSALRSLQNFFLRVSVV